MCIFSLTDWLILRNAIAVNKSLVDLKTLVQIGLNGYTMPQQTDLLPNVSTNGPSLSAKTLAFIALDELLNVKLGDFILHINKQSIIVPLIF